MGLEQHEREKIMAEFAFKKSCIFHIELWISPKPSCLEKLCEYMQRRFVSSTDQVIVFTLQTVNFN